MKVLNLAVVVATLLLAVTAFYRIAQSQPQAATPPHSRTGGVTQEKNDPMTVELNTTKGTIVLELYPDKAPATVENFLQYVRDGFYDGKIFHRVIPGFMIQGGGFEPGMTESPTRGPIQNEADNGLRNTTGSVAMARTPDPHSASAQFFINVKDNGFLDFRSATPQGFGYAVFGKVVEGMDVVQAIEQVETTSRAGHQDVPADDVVIESARVRDEG